MIFFRLALKSLDNRRFTSVLTVISIALSTALLLGVERAKRAAEEGFTQTISQTDLIVGARGGPLSLLMYTVFNMGNATNNISMKTFEEIRKNPNVEWTIPYSLGDGHRGFRVVGTTDEFYQHYHFRGDQRIDLSEGHRPVGLWDVVLGSAVARELNYKLAQKISVAHGVTKGEAILFHDDKPFTVVGILKMTGTALDRSLYITLEGLEGLHMDWQSGAMPSKDKMISPEKITKADLRVEQITAFFLRAKSRTQVLGLQRDINNYQMEPLLAIIPGVTLAELWHGMGYIEKTLRMIAFMVVIVGLIAMLISLLTGLNERRREMAILRALGASPSKIVALLVFESTVLTILGVFTGAIFQLLIFSLSKNWIENQFGLYLVGSAFTFREAIEIIIMIILGSVIGLIPALRAMRSALKDGLSVSI